jgi:hypothetical protein
MKKEATKKTLPKLVERISDGELLKLNKDKKTYSFCLDNMHTPYKYTYKRLFEDRRCVGAFQEFKGINLDNLVNNCANEIKSGKDYSLFVIRRMMMLPRVAAFGNYIYNVDETLKARFDSYLTDKDLSKIGYTDITSMPFEDKQNTKESLTREIIDVINRKDPENLVFYLRPDPKLITARILISISDFYGGLTQKEAIEKYGKGIFKKMSEHLTGITVSKNYDGKIRIPYSDLNYAYKKASGLKTNPEEWD